MPSPRTRAFIKREETMIRRILLMETLNAMAGVTFSPALKTTPVARSLKVYIDRGELDLKLTGKDLYNNAKQCLELASYEVESYE